MSNPTEAQYAEQLNTTARIDMIKHAWRKIKLRERQELIREKLEDAQELNFDDVQGEH